MRRLVGLSGLSTSYGQIRFFYNFETPSSILAGAIWLGVLKTKPVLLQVPPTHIGVFVEKYDMLRRWALHLAITTAV